jgi:L-gulonolactone oxidase
MTNLGSISEQSLAGVMTTATHGSGINFGVLSTQVRALSLLLADGSRACCSRTERPDLFLATICGLGATGIILSIQLDVEPIFRLREVQQSLSFDEVVQNLDHHVHSAEHVRFWWFPTMDVVRCSYSSRTNEVKDFFSTLLCPVLNIFKAPNPAGSWLWHSFMGYHVIQFLLFLGRYFLFLNTYVANFTCWLASGDSLGIDDSYRIFNIDCRVSLRDKLAKITLESYHSSFFFMTHVYSIHIIPRSGQFPMKTPRPACVNSANTFGKSSEILMAYDLIFL